MEHYKATFTCKIVFYYISSLSNLSLICKQFKRSRNKMWCKRSLKCSAPWIEKIRHFNVKSNYCRENKHQDMKKLYTNKYSNI